MELKTTIVEPRIKIDDTKSQFEILETEMQQRFVKNSMDTCHVENLNSKTSIPEDAKSIAHNLDKSIISQLDVMSQYTHYIEQKK